MRKFLAGCVFAALLVSCSSEDDTVSSEKMTNEVETIYELGKCTDSRRGEVFYVSEM